MQSTPIKSVPLSCTFAWPLKSNKYVATVSISGDDDFSQDAYLQIHSVDIKEQRNTSMPTIAKIKLPDRAQSLGWSSHGGKDGIIAAALVDGQVLIFSADALIAAGKQSGAKRGFVIDNESTGILSRITQHTSTVRACEFNPIQPQILATGGADRVLHVWNLADPKSPQTIPVCAKGTQHQTEIFDIKWNPKVFNILVSSSANGLVTVWDLKSKKITANFNVNATTPGQTAAAASLSWHPSVATLLAVARDEPSPIIQIWDVKKAMQPVQTFPVRELSSFHTGGILSIAWCPTDASLLASCARDGQTLFWNPENGEKVGNLTIEAPQAVSWIPGVGAVCAVSSFENNFGMYSTLAIGQGDKAPKWLVRPSPAVFGYGGKIALPAVLSSEIDPQFYIQTKAEAEQKARTAAAENGASPEQQQAIIQEALPPLTAVPLIAAPTPNINNVESYESTVSGRERQFQEAVQTYPVRSEEWLQWVRDSLSQVSPSVVVSAEAVTEGSRNPLLRYLDVNYEEAQQNAHAAGVAFDPSSAGQDEEDAFDNDDDLASEPEEDQQEGEDEDNPFDEADGTAEIKRQQKQQRAVEREQRRQQREIRRIERERERTNKQRDPPTAKQYEEIMAKCIVSGCMDDAIELAIKAKRFDDAFAAAQVAGPEQIRRVSEAFSESVATTRRVPQYLRAIGEKQWNIVAQDAAGRTATLDSEQPWREALALFATYADAQAFSEASFALCHALELAERTSDAAAVAALGGHVDRALTLFSTTYGSRSQRGVDTTTLVHLGTMLEYINSVGCSSECGSYSKVLLDHANDLAAEGDYELALYHANRASQLGLPEATVVADRLRFLVQPNDQVLGQIPFGPSRTPYHTELPEADEQAVNELYAILQRQQEEAEAKQQKAQQQQQQLQQAQQQAQNNNQQQQNNNNNSTNQQMNNHNQNNQQSSSGAGGGMGMGMPPRNTMQQNQNSNNNNQMTMNQNQNQMQHQHHNNQHQHNNNNNNRQMAQQHQQHHHADPNQHQSHHQQQGGMMNNKQAIPPPAADRTSQVQGGASGRALPRNTSNNSMTSSSHAAMNTPRSNLQQHQQQPNQNQQPQRGMPPPPGSNNNNQTQNQNQQMRQQQQPLNNNNQNQNQQPQQQRGMPPPPGGNPAAHGHQQQQQVQRQQQQPVPANNNMNHQQPVAASTTAPTAAAAVGPSPSFHYSHLPANCQNIAQRLIAVAANIPDRRKKDTVEKSINVFIQKATGLQPRTIEMLNGFVNALGNTPQAKQEWARLIDNCWGEVQSFNGLKFAM